MDSAQPIIVRKVKKGGHGHHGGAWKVAFADFVTAMMAFFMLMWLMGSTTPEERAAISDYFQNPSAVQGPGGASTSMIKLGAVDQQLNNKNRSQTQSVNDTKAPVQQVEVTKEVERDKQRLDNLKQDLEKAIESNEAMKPFKDQLLLDITPEGLRIQIIDKEGRPMFDSGSASLKSYTAEILHEMAKLINTVPNRISLTGHTDATPYTSRRDYSNWELSTDRANASRRSLVSGGLDNEKIAKVVGLASTVLFDKSNPHSPVNRRISLIVLNKAAERALQQDDKVYVRDAREMTQALTGDTSKPAPPATVPQDKSTVMLTAPAAREGDTHNVPTPTPLSATPLRPRATQPTLLKSGKTTRPLSLQSTPVIKPSSSPAPAKSVDPEKAPSPSKIPPIRPIRPINPIQIPVAPH